MGQDRLLFYNLSRFGSTISYAGVRSNAPWDGSLRPPSLHYSRIFRIRE